MKKINLSIILCLSLGLLKAQWNTSNNPHIYFNTGNVGIGATSPRAKVDVLTSAIDGSSTVGTFVVTGVDSYGQTLTLQAPLSTYTGHILQSYKGYGANGTAMLSGANFTNNNVNYWGVFNSSVSPKLVVLNNGNVGIGTTAPLASLTVGSGNAAFTLSNANDIGTGAWIRNDGSHTVFSTNTGNLFLGFGGNASKIIHIGNANPGVVQIAGNAPPGSVLLPPTGNVLIGKTTDVGQRLQVAGSVRFETNIANGFTVGNDAFSNHIAYNGTTGATTLAFLTSQNFSTLSNGASQFTGDGAVGNNVLFTTGARVVGYQQPFTIMRAYAQYGSSLIVDDDGLSPGPADYKIALFRLAGADKAYIDKNGGGYFAGNIGIGTNTPSTQLHTTGTVRFQGLTNDNIQSRVLVSDASGNLSYRDASTLGDGGGGTVNGSVNYLAKYSAANTVGNSLLYDNGTNVGVGTATPNTNAKLDVNGNIFSSGKIAIGTTDMAKISTYALAVNGDALFNKVKVKQYASWPDYVFHPGYKLPTLAEIEKFIRQYNHLPEVPSAGEIEANGIDLGSTQSILLKKIEELTLYVIEQNKRLDEQSKKIEKLEKLLK